ncbi:MAG: hypothetical protein IJS88_03755 [Alphaproteobacteria bacterium]|nr:hypothetical protein [Alphaproteobacteria bacterium]
MLENLKNKLIQSAIVVSGLFTVGTALSSCDELKSPQQKGKELVQKRNPTADSIKAAPYKICRYERNMPSAVQILPKSNCYEKSISFG